MKRKRSKLDEGDGGGGGFLMLHQADGSCRNMQQLPEQSELVSRCFEPSQPQRITSGLKTHFSLSPARTKRKQDSTLHYYKRVQEQRTKTVGFGGSDTEENQRKTD